MLCLSTLDIDEDGESQRVEVVLAVRGLADGQVDFTWRGLSHTVESADFSLELAVRFDSPIVCRALDSELQPAGDRDDSGRGEVEGQFDGLVGGQLEFSGPVAGVETSVPIGNLVGRIHAWEAGDEDDEHRCDQLLSADIGQPL